jgi:putative ABC transport system ATP-binding protein
MTADPTAAAPLVGRRLTRTYGRGGARTTAVGDVSIALERGRMTLFVGPSGSGKTTLLAMLSGLLQPDSGQVLALGQDVWKMSDSERERFRWRHCGFIFEDSCLVGSLTARQQLEIVLRWGDGVGAREARKRADATLALLGLAGRAHLRPDQLSGGEKQRVAIGRALIKRPTLCFADEPTGALDWASGEQVIELLRDAAHQGGATVLVVAHDERIVPYADRVFFMEDGRLRQPEARLAGAGRDDGFCYDDMG